MIVSQRINDSSGTGLDRFSLPAPFFHCLGIGYSVFSHGNLNRALDMKSPPPLNVGTENLRADGANQAMGATRANHNSAVSSCAIQCDQNK